MNRFVSPTPFDVRASIEYLLMVVAGGLGQIAGAVVGAGLVLLLKNSLQDLLPLVSQVGARLEIVAFSVIFILLLHHARAGLAGFVARRFGRRFGDPAAAADDADAPRRAAAEAADAAGRQRAAPGRCTRSSASAAWSRSTMSASRFAPARSSA